MSTGRPVGVAGGTPTATPTAWPAAGPNACAEGDSRTRDEGCITCGDVAVPLTVVDVTGTDARCRDEHGREEAVAVELIGPVTAGDRILVHAGVAIARLEPGPADRAPGSAPAGPNRHSATPTRGRPDALRR